jgi:hypothetical protein
MKAPAIKQPTGPGDLIRKFYSARRHRTFDRVIGHVDLISQIVLRNFGAEFVAIYYYESNESRLIPISCVADSSFEIPTEMLSEKQLLLHASEEDDSRIVSEGLFEGPVLEDVSITGDSSSGSDIVSHYRYPVYSADELFAVVVAAWNKVSPTISDNQTEIMSILGSSIIEGLSLFDDIQQVDTFSDRLSDLISIFETPLDEYQIHEYVVSIMRTGLDVFRLERAAVVAWDERKQDFRLVDVIGQPPDSTPGMDTTLGRVSKVMEEQRSGDAPSPHWYDLSPVLGLRERSILLIVFSQDSRLQIGLVLWVSEPESFKEDDLELLTLFHQFAGIALHNSSLVRDL